MEQKGSICTYSLNDAMELTKVGCFQRKLFLLCGSHFMSDALETSLVGFLVALLQVDWNLSPNEVSSVASVIFGGQLVGALLVWGPFSDCVGRRKCFLLGTFLTGCFGILSAVATSLNWILFCRFFVGIGVASGTTAFDLLAEFIPSHARGVYLVNMNAMFTLGSVMASTLAWLVLDHFGWRLYVFICAVPSIISLITGCLFLPESPWWLLEKDRMGEIVPIIHRVARVNGVTLPPFQINGAEVEDEKEEGEEGEEEVINRRKIPSSTLSIYMELFLGAHKWINFMLCLAYALCGFSYFGLILLISRVNTVTSSSASSSSSGRVSFHYLDILLNAAAELAGVFVAAAAVDRLGRRWTQAVCFGIAGLSVFLVTLPTGLPLYLVILFSALARLTSFAGFSTIWVITPELFPTRLRTSAHSIANAVAKLAAALSPYLALNPSVAVAWVGVTLAISNLLTMVLSLMLPETSGVNLQDVELADLSNNGSASSLPIRSSRSNTNSSIEHNFIAASTSDPLDNVEAVQALQDFTETESLAETEDEGAKQVLMEATPTENQVENSIPVRLEKSCQIEEIAPAQFNPLNSYNA